jgi:superfamily II DNA or RNA helicase
VERATGRDVIALALQPLATGAPPWRTILLPFDRVHVPHPAARPVRAGRAWLRRALSEIVGRSQDQPLHQPTSAHPAPWPHQLTAAVALLEGHGTRLLIADEVGLGKTLTAAVLLVELMSRGVARRALVLVPAGLRDQWRSELWRLARLNAEIVDAAALAARVRTRPPGQSTWTAPGIAIASVDFIKQPTVLAELVNTVWDVLVVDEAHVAVGESARAAAVRLLADRTRVMALLTATPHSGDRDAFRRLVQLGVLRADEPPMAWVRHQRRDLGIAIQRRTRVWRPRMHSDEAGLHARLHAYVSRVFRSGAADARLAMIVLQKRALSTPDALLCSLQHRRAALVAPETAQLELPLDDPAGELDESDRTQPIVLRAAGLADARSERAWLDELIALAKHATAECSKYRILERLVRRTTEPILLFTEYRDTLDAVVQRLGRIASMTVLHGGLDRRTRLDAVNAFTSGRARVLVATDTAAEGLNLQARCRLVVHVELPWSPVRLEQRVGRVDRLGQTRPVHVWQISGASGHERTVLAALARRVHAIRADLGGQLPADWRDDGQLGDERGDPALEGLMKCAVGQAIGRIADGIYLSRGLQSHSHLDSEASARSRRRGLRWMSGRRQPGGLTRGVLFVFLIATPAVGHAPIRVAVHVAMRRLPDASPSRWLPSLVDPAARVARQAAASPTPLLTALAVRERALLEDAEREQRLARRQWQASLFDRRAAQLVGTARQRVASRIDEHRERLAALEQATTTPSDVVPLVAIVLR